MKMKDEDFAPYFEKKVSLSLIDGKKFEGFLLR